MEMQLELKRMELEQRPIDAETEKRRMEVQTETENERIEAETTTRELQKERERREHELKMAEAGRPAEGGERGDYDDQNVDQDGDELGRPQVGPRRPRADRVKRYDSALKQVVSPMPSDATEIPQFFESLGAMFRSFEIPDDLRAKPQLPFFVSKGQIVNFSFECRGTRGL